MDLIELSGQVEERYRRYLKTTFYFKDPELRRSFEQALDEGRLSKGPYLEATPVFKRGQPPSALFQSLLGFQPDEGFLKAVQGDRPLYQHQEEAIRKVFEGRNIVVATGTGSGKTEAFLYPILLHLYQEFRKGQLGPGVRALILYPMNALANDQRERLGEICKRLKESKSPFRLTFGQYIGETPEDENDSQRHARDHLEERNQQGYSIVENGDVVHGELVLRSEMRRTPPHILLTNYSMLEYLLLRPDDSPLFDHGRARWWTFLVLDEAHQYRGSRGIEMAMLLRRLKQRLREGGRSEPFRCIATSATLVGGEDDKADVARFASDLFGEEFHEEDVILGETVPVPEPGVERFTREDYQLLKEVLRGQSAQNRNRLDELARRIGVVLPGDEELTKTVGRLLQQDSRAATLRRLITGSPIEVRQIADQVFQDLPEEERVPTLADLVELLLQAKDPSSGAPLLPARYHLFLRSLEGAFVSYWPEKKVFLDRKSLTGEGAAFEVALCRECGQHYFVAQKNFNGGKIREAIRDPNDVNFGATFLRPIERDEEASADDEDGGIQGKTVFYLCVQCGEAQRSSPTCGHNNFIRVVKEDAPADEDRADQLTKCGACGYTAAGRDPVREVVHGTDGPHAVIVTTLHQSLPEKRRKVLAFADGRQEAAFFAWYLEDSYKAILNRNLLLRVVQRLSSHSSEGLSLRELAAELRSTFRERRILPPATGDLELRREAWLSLYREFLTDEPRISLEGVGLIRWSIKWPDWFKTPEVLMKEPWSLSEQEARDLVLLLLDTMRADRAVELRAEPGVSLNWNDLNLQASQTCFRIGDPKGKKGVRSWDGKQGKRARFLAKLLMRIRNELSEAEAVNEAVNVLRAVWESIRQCDENAPSSYDRLLLSIEDARRLNPDWWRLHPIAHNDTIFQCDTCGRLQAISVRGVCPRHRCPGTLKPVQVGNLEPNHYRSLYEEDLPGVLRVEEHTAQLDKEKAREFQREFRDGKIHVLSCSTTFELGVDLGDLDIIFLRNVPPEAFNYAQRVGRAGRRSGYPGFAITYCRRNPHDLYHFSEPERMLTGKVRPPVLSLRNAKIITRHITAVALSRFFRAFPERFKTVESLFKDLEHPSGVADFKTFLYEHRVELEESLRAVVPTAMITPLGLDNGTWIDLIAGDETRFALAEAEVSSDYRTVIQFEKDARDQRRYQDAEWARKRAETIRSEEVLSFLSRKAVIPKYGFPVDVVELDTQRTQQNQEAFEVLLQRDLSIAIAEFAPTSKLVANKKVWTSYGLKRVAEKEWPRKFYKRCPKHNVFYQWEPGQPEPPTPCGDRLPVSQYVIPSFGFVTDRNKPRPPRSRTARVFTTRPYFAGSLGPEPDIILMPPSSPMITMRKASPGVMVVLCEGRRREGFYICGGCGAGFRKPERPHKTPYGQDCRGTLEQISLGHEFVTDVLQLQFHPKPGEEIDPVWFSYSLAYALVEGAAEVLEVPSTDINATVAYSQSPVPPIILYDNVPGGAGLVAHLEREEVLKACLEAARKRVSGNCGCEENTSCYGCLRSYRNQFAHQYLQRGPVMGYLETLLSKWQ
ncbi:DEAD/DEAH box helicase [Thermoflexus sp.]|uniref:DEAD/DEAH box helicase n=1 Tax=Thermoflexus sp. TaxID=1969742 RepID=UPI0035E434CC